MIYAIHARACIERGRRWWAEHYVDAVRDHALSLACLREGVTEVQARGEDVPSSTRAAACERSRMHLDGIRGI